MLLYQDPEATVIGLDRIPRDQWPPVAVVHVAFQVMVGAGMILMAVSIWAAWRWWRGKRPSASKAFLWGVALAGPLGFIAVEAGWIVTEVGRQPWIISGVMRTVDAVTPMPGLIVSLVTVGLVYLALGTIVILLIWRQLEASPYIELPTANH